MRPKLQRKTIVINGKTLATIGSIIIICFLVFSIYRTVKSFNFNWALSLLSKDLPTDNFGHTNFLLLGTGGKNHDGPDLTDSMIVASIDEESGDVTMLSIPRDLYIEDKKYNSRINQVYSNLKGSGLSDDAALEQTKSLVEGVVGMPIQYYVKIDFHALVEIVDTLGGVDIYVEETINDPLYPKGETLGYEPFYLEAGQHHLDGETALKFARSRHDSSDFGRSQRQQRLIFALKEKALSTGLIDSVSKIDELMKTLSENIDTNISADEVLQMASVANKFTKDKFKTYLIHDDPSRCGGFLYTPEQALFGGAFVLLPAGGQKYLNTYTNLIFQDPEILKSPYTLQILNGTKQNYLSAISKVILNRYCFNVVRFGNAQSQKIEKTSYFVKNVKPEEFEDSELEKYINKLKTFIPGEVSFTIPEKYLVEPYASNADVILEIGADYLPVSLKDPFDSLVSIVKPAEPASTTEGTNATTEGNTTSAATSEATTPATSTTPSTTSNTAPGTTTP